MISKFEQAELLLQGLNINNEDLATEAYKAVTMYGGYKRALIECGKLSFMNGTMKLLQIIKDNTDYSQEAEELFNIIHSTHKLAMSHSISIGSDYFRELERFNIRKMFKLSDKQVWVLNEIGGREYISQINKKEPNTVVRKLNELLERYSYKPKNEVITNKKILSLVGNL